MAKIKDLGIKVIPETMQPPGIGDGGGGCGACSNFTVNCIGCTQQINTFAPICQPLSCGVSPAAQAIPHCLPTCGFVSPACGCSLNHSCFGSYQTCGFPSCGFVSPVPCLTPTPCHCTVHVTCLITCRAFSALNTDVFTLPLEACHAPSGGPGPHPGLTQEHINTLKEELKKQIDLLDEHAKTIGPRTAAEIDAREKQLNDELTALKQRRKDLDKK